MKLSNREIYLAVPALDNLAKISITVKTAYKISKILNKLSKIHTAIDKQRTELIREFGDIDEKNPNIITPKPEFIKKINDDFDGILALEEDVNIEDSLLYIEDLVDKSGKDIDVPANVLSSLYFMFSEKPKEEDSK